MKTQIIKLIIFFLLLPNITLANHQPGHPAPNPPPNITPPANPNPPPTNVPQDPAQIPNPLKNAGIENVGQLITWFINLLLALVGVIAIISIMLAGYKMILGSGNSDEVEEAKKRIVWSLAGLAVVILAYTLVRLTLNLFQQPIAS